MPASLLRLPGLVCAAVLLCFVIVPVRAAESANLRVTDAWARWLPADLPAGGYLTLHNAGSAEVVLTGATSPDYAMVHLHESYTAENGDQGMRMVGRLPLPPGAQVQLQPGGYHLMLMHANHAVKPGDTVTVILEFADGSTLHVALPVKPAGTQH
ncbi:MAG: copper chaperone PCu(A)C [Opitutales bacterium]